MAENPFQKARVCAEQLAESTKKIQKNSHAGRKKGSTNFPDRGLRLVVECEKALGKISNRALAELLGYADTTVLGWKSGANIDNAALAKLMDHGVNVAAIIGAKKSPSSEPGQYESGARAEVAEVRSVAPIFEPDPNCTKGQLCVQISTLLRLLLDTISRASTDPTRRAEIERSLDLIAEVLRRSVAG